MLFRSPPTVPLLFRVILVIRSPLGPARGAAGPGPGPARAASGTVPVTGATVTGAAVPPCTARRLALARVPGDSALPEAATPHR